MDWLRDRKNLPIIAGITGVIIAVAVVFFVMQMRKSSAVPPDTMSTPPPVPSGGVPGPPNIPGATPTGVNGSTAGTPSVPATPSAPAAHTPPRAKPGAKAAVETVALEPSRPDPFLPLNYGEKPKHVPVPRLYVPSPGRLFPPRVEKERIRKLEEQTAQLAPQPQRRMAGLLYNQRLYAILETDGNAQIVKPGDQTADGTAIVQTIEPNRIILRTLDQKNPRTIEVKMAAAAKPAETPQAVTTPEGTTPAPGPYGPYGPYSPYGGPYRGRGTRGLEPPAPEM